MKILVLNAGSSTQKSCLYQIDDELPIDSPKPLWQSQIDWDEREGSAELRVTTDRGEIRHETFPSTSKSADTINALQTLWSGSTQSIERLGAIDIDPEFYQSIQ